MEEDETTTLQEDEKEHGYGHGLRRLSSRFVSLARANFSKEALFAALCFHFGQNQVSTKDGIVSMSVAMQGNFNIQGCKSPKEQTVIYWDLSAAWYATFI